MRASILIIALAIVMFAIQATVENAAPEAYFEEGNHDAFVYYIALSPSTLTSRPWTLVTGIFAHGDILHLFINCIVLFWAGSLLERTIGKRRFIMLFLVSALLAGFLQVSVLSSGRVGVGASGGILGVLGALVVVVPRTPVLLFFFIPMPLRCAMVFFCICSSLMLITCSGTGIGHVAHLVGFSVGLVYGRYVLNGPTRKRAYEKSWSCVASWRVS